MIGGASGSWRGPHLEEVSAVAKLLCAECDLEDVGLRWERRVDKEAYDLDLRSPDVEEDARLGRGPLPGHTTLKDVEVVPLDDNL